MNGATTEWYRSMPAGSPSADAGERPADTGLPLVELLAERIVWALKRYAAGGWLRTKDLTMYVSPQADAAHRKAARDLLLSQGRVERRIAPATGGRRGEQWRLVGR